MSSRRGGLGRVLCALDIEHEEWAPLAIASVMADSFRVPLDALYAAKSGVWEDRTERVRRLIAEHSARERLEQLSVRANERSSSQVKPARFVEAWGSWNPEHAA